MVEGVVVDRQEDDDLPKERYSKPRVEDSVWGSYTGDRSQRLCVGKEIEVN